MKYHLEFDLDFKRNPHKGLYIALEGIDGSGKTVQVERLAEYFKKRGKAVLPVSEPRRTGFIGRVINEFLQKRITVASSSLQYLYTADRIAHQEEIILPALKREEIVISHRCFWSALPYGILDRSGENYNYDAGETILVAQGILSMYHQIVVPDITFILQVSSKTAVNRLQKLGSAKEYYETEAKLTNVKKGYDWMIEKFPKEFIVINAEQSVDRVTEDIIRRIRG